MKEFQREGIENTNFQKWERSQQFLELRGPGPGGEEELSVKRCVHCMQALKDRKGICILFLVQREGTSGLKQENDTM